MINFFKSLGKGILYILAFPFLIVFLLLLAVICLFIYIIVFFVCVIRFFRGKKIFPPLLEDIEAKKIIESLKTAPDVSPQTQHTHITYNQYNLNANPNNIPGFQNLPPSDNNNPNNIQELGQENRDLYIDTNIEKKEGDLND